MQVVRIVCLLILIAQSNVYGWIPRVYVKPLIRNYHPPSIQTSVPSKSNSSAYQPNMLIDDRFSLDMFSVRNSQLC